MTGSGDHQSPAQFTVGERELLTRLDERTTRLGQDVEKRVTRAEFGPIRLVVFGMVGLILSAVVAGIMSFVLKGGA